jgi:hypothetical protein
MKDIGGLEKGKEEESLSKGNSTIIISGKVGRRLKL